MSNRQYLRATCLLVLLLFCVRGDAETFVYVSLASENKLARYQLDPASGALTFKESIDVEADPGVLTVHPSKKFFYAAMRNAGRLVSYRLDAASGKLTSINSIKADDDPCYIAFDRTGKLMLTSYYVAGKAAVHELNSDGAIKPVGKFE